MLPAMSWLPTTVVAVAVLLPLALPETPALVAFSLLAKPVRVCVKVGLASP